jgi:serine phosphatase RsbU (regulator of sigma subunit)
VSPFLHNKNAMDHAVHGSGAGKQCCSRLPGILLAVLCALTLYACGPAGKQQAPEAVKGVIDLRSWDFDRDGSVELLGEWKYYEGKLLTPEDIKNARPAYQSPKRPDLKDTIAGYSRKILKPHKYATYRLTILLPPEPEIMGLNISDVFFASQAVWINGRMIHRNGDPGKEGLAYNFTGQFNVFFTPDGQRITITQQAGYLARSLILGSHKDLSARSDRDNLSNTMVIAAIIIMGLYHLALFWYRRKDRSALFFSMGCFFVPVYHLASNYEFTIADTGLNTIIMTITLEYGYGVVIALWLCGISGIIFSSYYYLRAMYNAVIGKALHRIAGTAIIISVLSITNTFFYSAKGNYLNNITTVYALFTLTNITILITAVVCIMIMIRACLRKIHSSYIIFFGMIFPVAAVIIDVMIVNGILDFTKTVIWGLLLMLFTQSVAITRRFALSFNAEERLTDELRELNRTLEEKVAGRTVDLQAANEEMAAINEDLVQARDALWGEMQIAKKIQTVLLPESPRMAGYEIVAYMKPADDVGGDYYDVIHSHGRDWLVIGDVSGHGIPAGLIMMMVQTSIQTVIEERPDLPPHELLILVNRVISNNIARIRESKYMTITVFACHDRGEFYFSGHHQNILIYRATTGQVDTIETRGMWLGVKDDIRDMVDEARLQLAAGDVMLLYTDGITESWPEGSNKDERIMEEMYGEDRLREVLGLNGALPCATIRDKILASFKNYRQTDDVTLMLVKRSEA